MREETILLMYVVGVIICIAIYYFFVRWVFSINKQLKNQKTIIELLCEIAKKQGVDNDLINDLKIDNDLIDELDVTQPVNP